jgi:hypothetical protein
VLTAEKYDFVLVKIILGAFRPNSVKHYQINCCGTRSCNEGFGNSTHIIVNRTDANGTIVIFDINEVKL